MLLYKNAVFLDQVTENSPIQTETAGRLDPLKEADIKCNMHFKTLSENCLLTWSSSM